MNIILIGFMGTGKSAVGSALAHQLSWRWMDTDHEIEKRFGKSIRQIFAEEGQDAFRDKETRLLKHLATRCHNAHGARSAGLVLSTGGGTPLREENARLLKQIGAVICLTAAPELILKRVGRNLSQRPLLASHEHDPLSRIQSLFAERKESYANVADYLIDTTDLVKPSNTASKIIELLRLTEEQ